MQSRPKRARRRPSLLARPTFNRHKCPRNFLGRLVDLMPESRRLIGAASAFFFLVCSFSFAQNPLPAPSPASKAKTISVDQIRPGMQGVAYTVFQGTQPEPTDFVVLGVLRNLNGPKGSVILIRLHGQKVEYTGVVAGMSGSPAYIDGKLAGALAFRIGEFSKEPIAGVTPISEMLEINAMDTTPSSVPVQAKSVPGLAAKTSGPCVDSLPAQDFA